MVGQGFLTDSQGEKFKEKPLGINYRVLDYNNGPAPHFMEFIRRRAESVIEELYGDSINLYRDGLRIYTTLNAQLQDFANEAVRDHMVRLQNDFDKHWKNRKPWEGHPEIYVSALKKSSRYQTLEKKGMSETQIMKVMETPVNMVVLEDGEEKMVEMTPADSVAWAISQLQTGFLAVNPSDGTVMAWVGGANFKFFQYDHVLSKRQVGSTFKPFVYATALEEGYDPCDYISNEQRVYRQYDDWSPANSDGEHEGFYSLQGALVNSINTVSAELVVETGPHDVADLAHSAGISSDIPDVPSIALGTANLSLYEMVRAYTAFANYGNGIELQSLVRIEDSNGKTLYEAEPAELLDPAFEERTARLMVHMLQGVVERGTAASLRNVYGLRTDLAGKTGTTQDNADGWFIGFSPGLVAGVWVGAESPGIRFRSTALGQGAYTALPVFGRFMQKIERTGLSAGIGRRSFYPLPENMLECPDFSEEDPDMNFFERLFGGRKDKDDQKEEEQSPQDEDSAEKEKKENGKSLLDKMKDIFRKKE
jgi:penicillin-binding protein 1A